MQILDTRGVDFEYDGEMAADVALDRDKLALYPFCPPHRHRQCADHAGDPFRLDLDQAAAADGRRVSVMGPLLVGLEKSVQIAPLGAKMSEIYNAAIIAAYDIND